MTGEELRALTPRGSDWDALAWWLDHDAEPIRGVERSRRSLASFFLSRCCLPGRGDVLSARLAALGDGGIRPSWSPAPRNVWFSRLASWTLANDIDHAELAVLLDHAQRLFAQAPPNPDARDEVAAWLRVRWMREGGAWDDTIDDALRQALARHAFAFPHPDTGRTAWIPSSPRSPTALSVEHLEPVFDDARRYRFVLGLSGAAAAGKSTLARQLLEEAGQRRIDAWRLVCDDLTWPGEGFRYVHEHGMRRTLLHGPGIYDHMAIREAVLDATADGDATGLVIVEGVYTGCYPAVAARLDMHAVIRAPDRERLERKIARDTGDPRRRIDIVADFARKQYDEVIDVIDAGLC